MYAFISGIIYSVGMDEVIINNHGIGYRVFMSHSEQLKVGQEILVFVYQQIREDAHTLYGFLEKHAYDLFLELIKVKGIGCRIAMGILSTTSSSAFIQAIEQSDIQFMKRLPGIGAKTAQQIILDLKGKLVADVTAKPKAVNRAHDEVEQALKSLGYKQSEITPIINQLPAAEEKTIDQMIKLALALMLKSKGG